MNCKYAKEIRRIEKEEFEKTFDDWKRDMKNKTFILNISWCPDSIDSDSIREILENELGLFAEVHEGE